MSEDLLLEKIKDKLLDFDPVHFVEKYLTIDGDKFHLQKGGWKPFSDIYRYVGIKAIEKDGKPVVIVAGRQVGKDLALDTPIPTPSGWKTMGDLQIGDKVFDENGDICDVIEVSPIYTDHKCYKLTFDDGTEIVAGEDHQWLTYTKSNRKSLQRVKNPSQPTIKNTKEIINTLNTKTSKQETNHSIPICEPVKYNTQNLPIDPYVFGCWLGDGSSNTGVIECADEGILLEIKKHYIIEKRNIKNNKSKSNAYRIGEIQTHHRKIGELTNQLKKLNLLNNKHIPDIYLYSSIEQRFALLQGLMDTDGHNDKTGKQEFCNYNKKLAYQVLELIKSLGIKARIKESDAKLYGKVINKRYHIYFNTSESVFRLQRKLNNIKEKVNLKTTHRYIVKAELVSTVPTKCIMVDSPSHLYLVSKSFIPTHNTSMAAALEMYFCGCGLYGNGKNPPIRMVHAFPEAALAAGYAKVKLNAMIRSSITIDDGNELKGIKKKTFMHSLLDTSSESNDTLSFKQFIGGNHLWIESVGMDGNRLMGKTADIIFYDEVQKMMSIAIGNSSKILTQSKYGKQGEGVQVFFGTPLLRGSTYWDLWNASSQQYFHLGCEKCKELFPLYTPGTNDWEDIWLYGYTVRCTHCGFEQDKREATERGKWVPLKDQQDSKYIGFHINQLYIPTFTKEKIISEKPENNPINSEKTYQTQVLGEFYHGEATIITMDQVRELCGDSNRKFRASISSDEDLPVFLGIDIGAKNDLAQLVDSDRVKPQGQSFSTAVVIAMTGPQRMSIEFATAFKRNDLASKKGLIEEIMRKYSVNLAVCDLGYANDLNEILQTEYGERFLSSQASNRVNEHIKFNSDIFPKVITFERDFWIAELYEQMKKGNLRIPMGSYEQVAMMIQHICSMEIKPSISRVGDVTPHYVKGGSPNDFFMSILNAYIAFKFYVSQGFKIKNPAHMRDPAKDKPPVLVAYLPKMR
jgi:hypothetical protein